MYMSLIGALKNIRLQVTAKKSEKIFRGGFVLISGFLLQNRHKTLILSEELRETGRAFPTASFAHCAFARIRAE